MLSINNNVCHKQFNNQIPDPPKMQRQYSMDRIAIQLSELNLSLRYDEAPRIIVQKIELATDFLNRLHSNKYLIPENLKNLPKIISKL